MTRLLIRQRQVGFQTQYAFFAESHPILALLAYEYTLVLERERHAFWHPPYKISQILYFMIRYAPLIARIPVLIKAIARFDPESSAVSYVNIIVKHR